jgi:hypothetical protein
VSPRRVFRDRTLIGTALSVDSTQSAVRSAATEFVLSQHKLGDPLPVPVFRSTP